MVEAAHGVPQEGPFTAFGQFGPDRLDLRVLEQGTWWVNQDGLAFRIDSEMSAEYIRNVLALVHRHAVSWHLRALLQLLTQHEQPDEAASAASTRALSTVEADAHAWAEGTPLLKALRSRLATLTAAG